MIAMFFVIGLVCAWYAVACSKEKMNIIKSIVFAIVGYIFSHILLSGGLFVFDQYSIKRTVFLCMICWGIVSLISIIKRRTISLEYNIRDYMIPIIFSVIGILFTTFAPFEYFGMGQDEGVYQTKAIFFINGITEKRFDIEEYYMVDSPTEKEAIAEATIRTNLSGLHKYMGNNLRFMLTGSEEATINENTSVFHGIPTFPALLALWGKIFGMEHMSGIVVVFFVCCIFLIYEICTRLNISMSGKCIALFTYTWSPIVIWTSKSTLTEAGITLIWLVFIFCILSRKNVEILVSAICVLMYSLFHVSAYVFMPLFVLIYLGLFLFTSRKVYIKALILSVSGYLIGYWIICITSYTYVFANYSRIYIGFINSSNVFYVVNAVCICVIILGIILLCMKNIQLKWNIRYLNVMVKVFCGIATIYIIAKCINMQLPVQDLPFVTICSFIIMTGIAVPLILFWNVTIRTSFWLENRKRAILLALFLYCIVFYSMLLVKIGYYYYYARYLVMYIPIIAIMGALILQNVKLWKVSPILILSFLLFLPYNICLLNGKDDSRIEWDTLYEISEVIEEQDVLILDKELFYAYYLPLKAINEVEIYPFFDDFEQQCNELNSKGHRVYCLTFRKPSELENNSALILRVQNTEYQDLGYESNNILQMPTSFTKTNMTLSLYRCR